MLKKQWERTKKVRHPQTLHFNTKKEGLETPSGWESATEFANRRSSFSSNQPNTTRLQVSSIESPAFHGKST